MTEGELKDLDPNSLDPRTREYIARLERMEPSTRDLPLRTKVNLANTFGRPSTRPALRVTTHVFPISPGKPGAPIGTREWADFLRLSLVSMVDHAGEQDDRLLSSIQFMREHRGWTLMNKPDGSFFSNVEDFCAFRRPYGLGRSWTDLRPFFLGALAKRGTPPDEVERALQLDATSEVANEAPTAVDRLVSAIERLVPKQRAELLRRVKQLRTKAIR